MKKLEYVVKSFWCAFGAFLYIAGVAWFMFHIQVIFGQTGKPDNFLAPLFALLLFVVSACITGFLVLGKPIQLYLEGLKKEAFLFLSATIAWLVLFLFVIVVLLLFR